MVGRTRGRGVMSLMRAAPLDCGDTPDVEVADAGFAPLGTLGPAPGAPDPPARSDSCANPTDRGF